MDSYVESAKNQIAENVYITFKEIIDGIQNNNYIQNYLAIQCLFEVFAGIGKVKMEVPLFKMISSYANKYRSTSQLEKHPSWVVEVDKIFKACKVRKELDVESVINDMVNLGADEIALLEEK